MSKGLFYAMCESHIIGAPRLRERLRQAESEFPHSQPLNTPGGGTFWHYDYYEIAEWLEKWFGIEGEP